MLTLEFEKRDMESLGRIRKSGKMPAIFYGPKEKSTSIALKENDFKKIWKEAGESSIIILKGNDGEEHEALIQEVDTHPVTGSPRHADFYVIEKGKKLQIKVPLEFIGVSAAVKDMAGTLVKVLHELEIEAMPKDLPREINIDIAALENLESQILAKDIALPAGVELLTKPDDVVAAISVAKEEEEAAVAPTIDDIELVDQKGKEPGEEAEAGAENPEKKTQEKK